jgi:site-specific recombinase XerD
MTDIKRYLDALKVGMYTKSVPSNRKEIKLRKSLASEHNIGLILKFVDEQIVNGKSEETMRNYIFVIHMFAEFLNEKRFEDVGKEDVISYINFLMTKINKKSKEKLKENTINLNKARIRTFYRWLNNGEYPDFIKPIKVKIDSITVRPDQILTEEEIKKLIETADNIRDKAIVSVLYESGCRIGELLNMRIRDFRFDDFGAIVTVDGKTGKRNVRLVNSIPYLKMWLKYHPDKKDDSWVWASKYGKIIGQLKYLSIYIILKDLAKKSGITKNVHPHILRHSRITHVALKMPESSLRIMYGWVAGSEMTKTYINISGKDVDELVLSRLYDINTDKIEEKVKLLVPKVCYNCGERNPVDYEYWKNSS